MELTFAGSISPRMMLWAIMAANLSDVVIVVNMTVSLFPLETRHPLQEFLLPLSTLVNQVGVNHPLFIIGTCVPYYEDSAVQPH